VFKIIEAMIRPGMEVSALLHAANDYYKNEGVLDEAYWIGGYELGIAFPPDWVGAFIYDDSITAPGETFEPMTVVNHESVFFAPLKSGLSLTIDTLIFGPRDAKLASTIPRELRILGA